MLAALPEFEASELFTDAEKAALDFAEKMANDHKAAPWDDVRARLGEYYSEAQIMGLGWRMAIFIGYGKLVFFTGLQSVGEPCPINFNDASAG
ncbi:MAG: hypothetical protein ACU84Q_17630 [Gammaproteobacteria bacterium]